MSQQSEMMAIMVKQEETCASIDNSESEKTNLGNDKTDTENDSEFEEAKSNNNVMLTELQKKKKRGIIYLSTIPKYMNVTKIRETFSVYGKLGRVYLQLAETEIDDTKKKKKRKVPAKHFTEGWVEFESKKVAKHVAATLNNTQIATRKKSKFFDTMWNIKYLPRFKWTHLSERLAYERAVHKQRLRAEIAQAKREVNFFSYNVDRSKKLRKKQNQGESTSFVIPDIKQRETDMEIRSRKNENKNDDRTQFLKSLFGK
ncbi:activator of basal transcription 1 isoform X2 [Cephus cinctus]|uniref:Activator of basal transcription 1 n=1 Tax=Cephus cinctus TaxID=211228 RepID=A0AAJ7RMZ1_CEPCN|nr:activator of basal transcription 1 isoform X2 [Cephus cinctus]XP_015601703.1 activator of basal transcription 1 isoform X2 [Cephus cinctus]XP_024943914.1 activator of basal transcription 1 isoform X2 [Cephus cinctus]